VIERRLSTILAARGFAARYFAVQGALRKMARLASPVGTTSVVPLDPPGIAVVAKPLARSNRGAIRAFRVRVHKVPVTRRMSLLQCAV